MPRASAISLRVTTAESGKPLAMGLPVVTMSGHTPASPAPPATLCEHLPPCGTKPASKVVPCVSKAQKWEPTLPKPVCTSSATHSPPTPRTASYAVFRYCSGSVTCTTKTTGPGSVTTSLGCL